MNYYIQYPNVLGHFFCISNLYTELVQRFLFASQLFARSTQVPFEVVLTGAETVVESIQYPQVLGHFFALVLYILSWCKDFYCQHNYLLDQRKYL